eukprot:3007706-Rhodomonas_salina.2
MLARRSSGTRNSDMQQQHTLRINTPHLLLHRVGVIHFDARRRAATPQQVSAPGSAEQTRMR